MTMADLRSRKRGGGFTLTEMLVVLAIVVTLAGIAFPLIRSGVRASHKAGCLSNLQQIGMGLESYLQDHNQRMPELEAGRKSRSEDLPVIEVLLEPYLRSEEVFHCPADKEVFAASGSSYLWNTTQNGLPRTKLSFFGEEGDLSRIPLVIDKESWHGGGETGSNFLYADYSATNRIQFSVSP
ncbi:type II secretion system protein [Haloferula sp.]|uniref:type II secretion system protein n=1 Tax=Haloferula sp. TaxID=2497595 RepID=UPI003C7570D5